MKIPPGSSIDSRPGARYDCAYAFLVTCTGFSKDASGRVQEIRVRLDPESRGGDAPDGRRVRATLHWVSARHAVPATARLYDRLFRVEEPGRKGDFTDDLNPDSMRTISEAQIEPAVRDLPPGARIQLERLGYFVTDAVEHRREHPVFNRTVSLRDTWARIMRRGGRSGTPVFRPAPRPGGPRNA